MRILEEVHLSVEEAEAFRLKDLENLEQEQGAERMNVSRGTFQRVLASARQKMADALLDGKAIRIDDGSFEMAHQRFRCQRGHEWDSQMPSQVNLALCPTCNEPDVQTVNMAGLGPGRGRGRKGYGGIPADS